MASKDLPIDYIKEELLETVLNDLKRDFGWSNKELDKIKRKKEPIHHLAKLYVKKTKPNITLTERDKLIKEIENSFKNSYLDLGSKKNLHVACFSETYESIVMWSHYANNHKGFCVEYNFKELGSDNPVTRFIFPIIYNNTIFDMKDYLPDSKKVFDNVLKKYMGSIKEDDILEGITLPKPNKNINNMVIFYNALIKSNDWTYEKEWRYVFPYTNTLNKKVYLNVPKPKAIYLGAMVCKQNCKKILEIGEERDINIYKMDMKPSEFALESNIIQECNNIQECTK